jgi:(2Fe-2S) ferredoxin
MNSATHKFCSLLTQAEGEPLTATAPERTASVLIPAPKSRWHTSLPLPASLVPPGLASHYLDGRPLTAHYQSADERLSQNDVVMLASRTKVDFVRLDEQAPGVSGKPLTEAPTVVLAVCTDGKKDACCAKFGHPLFNDLIAATGNNPDVVVVEASHLGGCRFAPTLLSVCSGNMYGHIEHQDIPRIIAAEQASTAEPRSFRGNIYATELECWAMQICVERYGFLPDISQINSERLDDNRYRIRVAGSGQQTSLILKNTMRTYSLYSGCRFLENERAVERHLFEPVAAS